MTLREFAKGYDGNIMLKAFENEKSTAPTAIMMTQITDLADCVKEYDKHEAETLLNVVEARGNNGSITDIENVTTSIAAVAEAYPELKSNENYKELMNELSTTENMILQYRTAYNNEVRAYKKYVRKFPYKQILGIMGYEVINYDYLEYSEEDRQPVSNLFGE